MYICKFNVLIIICLMNTIKLYTEHLGKFVNERDMSSIHKELIEAKRTLLDGSGLGSDFLGWIDLPNNVSAEELENIKKDVKTLSGKAKIFVVIGIGGSYLGARAVIEALQSEFSSFENNSEHPYIVYAGHTLSEDYYYQLLQLLDKSDYAVAVISKSGTTTEPAVAFRIIKSHMEQKYGKERHGEPLPLLMLVAVHCMILPFKVGIIHM